MRLVDQKDGVGEIAIRGHNVMKGYWNKPEATAQAIDADGWFQTGDMGRVDDDGYFFIVDRKKEMIIRGGFNIYPREIEEVLHEHPDVMEAAIVGIPHDELGEEVGAAVVLKPGHQAEADDIRRFVKDRVAAYKYPPSRVVRGCPAQGADRQDRAPRDQAPVASRAQLIWRAVCQVSSGAARALQTDRPAPDRPPTRNCPAACKRTSFKASRWSVLM